MAYNIWWCKWLLCEGTILCVGRDNARRLNHLLSKSILIKFAPVINENIVHMGIERYALNWLHIILSGHTFYLIIIVIVIVIAIVVIVIFIIIIIIVIVIVIIIIIIIIIILTSSSSKLKKVIFHNFMQ